MVRVLPAAFNAIRFPLVRCLRQEITIHMPKLNIAFQIVTQTDAELMMIVTAIEKDPDWLNQRLFELVQVRVCALNGLLQISEPRTEVSIGK